MPVLIKNNAASKLAASINSSVTTFSVTTGEGAKFPAPGAGDWFPVTLIKGSGVLEIMRCTARSGDVFTVTRGQESTAAAAFTAGDRVELRLTQAAFNELQANTSAAQATADAAMPKAGGTFTGDVRVPSINGGQLAGMRNKLINGNPLVNQRTVSGTVTLAAGAYGHDRWKAGASGCTYTFVTTANVTTITITAGSLQQVIEGKNLQSGTHTLSWSGTAQGKIGAGSYGASGITWAAVGGTNLTVEFNAGTLSLAQLEPGPVATPFEHRPYGQELALCLEYTFAITNGGTGQPICPVGFTSSTTIAHGVLRFPVRMRSSPTMSFIAGNASSLAVLGAGGGDISLTNFSADTVGPDSCRLIATIATGLPQGYASVLRVATSPILIFSAEI